MAVSPGSVIVPDWHKSPEGKEYLATILRKNKRKFFGLIERPVLPPQMAADTASYKIFVSGKSGVGKTAMVAKLAGLEVPSAHHETTGIQLTTVYWPAKLRDSGRALIFRFHFWDCGEAALKKFDHILPVSQARGWGSCHALLSPGELRLTKHSTWVWISAPRSLGDVQNWAGGACKEKADGILFLFSFTDRSSFDDLPSQISRVTEGSETLVKIVIGSKFDQFMHADVTERDLAEFRQAWRLPVLRMKSVNGPRLADGQTLDGRAGLAHVAHVLNGLAEHLWYQDQVMAGLVPAPQPGTEETSLG
ncbi:hypothetical protein KIL84_022140 [Mauremys mutica]|uniref:Ciliogenesis and planar polarity effector 2 n=1 Tax=Mauremys mutica TaxID=74926 RepID=A0A9D3XAE0_9SAUR|nr:hypothetical protein KIL84_022140 [Mauremys mutica]